MDPLFSASTPVSHAKRRSRPSMGNSETAYPINFPLDPIENINHDSQLDNTVTGKLPAGLRRSTGLFNLKIGSSEDDVLNDSSSTPGNKYSASRMKYSALGNTLATPNATVYGSRSEHSSLSLKRPHPFNSAKSAKQSGFLARSNSILQISPQNSKRQHLTIDTPKGEDMSANSSFKGAKPVQTAFISNGLQSKQHVPQTPKPRVPETPVKKSLANDSTTINSSTIHLDHGSPFPGSRTRVGLRQELGSLSELDVTSQSSPETLNSRLDISRTSRTPIDRLERFSITQIQSDESEMPETPTRNGSHLVSGTSVGQTSTPLHSKVPALLQDTDNFRKHDDYRHEAGNSDHFLEEQERFSIRLGAGRQTSSEPVTVTPGTAIKPSVRSLDTRVLKSADPTNSMSMSPSDSLHSSSFGDDMPQTPGHISHDVIVNSSSTESQSSPKPRRRLRLFGLRPVEKTQKNDNASSNNVLQLKNPRRRSFHQSTSHVNASNTPQCAPHRFEPFQSSNLIHSMPSIPSVPLDAMAPPMPSPIPPLRVDTPLGRTHFDLSPRTPGGQGFVDVPTFDSTASSYGILDNHIDSTKLKSDDSALYDDHLASRFDKVQSSANGEFSCVFVVAQGKLRFAVKRTKKPMLGQHERARRREEVQILQSLSSQLNDSHVIQLVDEWEFGNFGYIMTEYCENGDLNKFLAAQGRVSRLEEWRVWKILVEVLHGLAVIHSQNILHLDLKPANVFVTFEGHLKIGDFGMATRCPPPQGFEREGDREYIAPEVLERHQYGKPADVFSVGLMMVEVAANIVLPDNGVHWHRLRSGDLSDAGRLSSSDLAINMSSLNNISGTSNKAGELTRFNKAEIPPWAPRFLVDDSCLLDKVVTLMLSPQPERRPTVAQLLTMPEIMLVYQRGQAGAIVYEGDFGPEPEMEDEISVWQRA